MVRPHPALLVLVAILAIIQSSPRAHAGDPATITTVYMPFVACLGCAGVQPSPVPSPVPTPDPTIYVARMVEQVNAARVEAGCPTAVPNAALMRATDAWSTYMRTTGDYSHGTNGPGQHKYDAYPGGVLENIAGASTPEFAFDAWFTSPLHQRNMLWCYPPSDPSYDPARQYEIGVGYNDGYWTLAIGWYTY